MSKVDIEKQEMDMDQLLVKIFDKIFEEEEC